MIKFLSNLISTSKLTVILMLALSATSYLLITSYKTNGKQDAKIKILQQNNHALQTAYDQRLVEFQHIQQKMIERQQQQKQVDFDEQFFRKKLAEVSNENCIDYDLGDEFASVFTATSSNGEGLPSD